MGCGDTAGRGTHVPHSAPDFPVWERRGGAGVQPAADPIPDPSVIPVGAMSPSLSPQVSWPHHCPQPCLCPSRSLVPLPVPTGALCPGLWGQRPPAGLVPWQHQFCPPPCHSETRGHCRPHWGLERGPQAQLWCVKSPFKSTKTHFLFPKLLFQAPKRHF